MKLGTKTRYGARAMLYLALHEDEGTSHAHDIALDQQLSPKYLEQLLSALQAAGLTRTVRGAQGGHLLARPAEQISLRDIYDALEGSGGLVDCTLDGDLCGRSPTCVTREVWAEMYDACMKVLEGTTLAQLAQRARAKQAAVSAAPSDYCL